MAQHESATKAWRVRRPAPWMAREQILPRSAFPGDQQRAINLGGLPRDLQDRLQRSAFTDNRVKAGCGRSRNTSSSRCTRASASNRATLSRIAETSNGLMT